MKDYFKYCNAFVILTREGVVLTSDDTRITPEEDRYLQNLNRRLSERKYKRGKGSMTLDIKALREQLNKTRRDIDRNVYLIKSAEAKMLRVDPGGGEFYDLIDTVENVKSEIEKLKCSEVQLMKKAWDLEQKRIEQSKAAAGITEEINTYTGWKQLGYEVLHGSKALFNCCLIWGSRGDGATYKASFFGESQVQPI